MVFFKVFIWGVIFGVFECLICVECDVVYFEFGFDF